jgi:hypothetical protein
MGSYWDQTVERAEWDLPLEHPEVGWALVLLAGAGIVVGLADRRQRTTVAGWLLFALLTGAIVAPYQFRAFRNLLAFVPLACVAAGLLYSRLRRLATRRWRPAMDLVAALLPVALFTPALVQHMRYYSSLEDSREKALAYLAAHARGKRVLVLEELTFLPSRLATLPADVQVRPWERARERIETRRFHYLVLGDLRRADGGPRIRPATRERVLFDYEPRARFGAGSTPAHPGAFRFNQQTVLVLARKPRPASGRTADDGSAR